MFKKTVVIIIILFLNFTFSFGQTLTLASLKEKINLNQKNDTANCFYLVKLITLEENRDSTIKYLNQLNNLTDGYLKTHKRNSYIKNRITRYSSFAKTQLGQQYQSIGELKKAIGVCQLNLQLYDTLNHNEELGEAYFYLAQAYTTGEQIDSAIFYYTKAIGVFYKSKSYPSIASIYADLANIYLETNNLQKAISSCFDCVRICEKYNCQFNSIQALRTLAIIYNNQNEKEKALKISFKALNLAYRFKQETYQAQILHLLGYIYSDSKSLEAINYYKKSLVISSRLKNLYIKSYTLNNLGGIYYRKNELDSAINYYEQSLAIQKQLNQTAGIVVALTNIGKIYTNKKNIKRSLKILNQAMQLAKINNNTENLMKVSNALYVAHKSNNNYAESLKYYEQYINLNDSIIKANNANLLIKSQLKYEYEKKAAADSVKVAEEKKLNSIKLEQEKTQKQYLYIGLVVIALFGIFMFNRFMVTKKQKSIIEEQKNLVEKQKELVDEKQKEILESIHYAKRIQKAILPNEQYIIKKIS